MVSCNGLMIADEQIGGDATLGLDIPEAAWAGQNKLDIVLSCPDAVAPCKVSSSADPRCLGVAVTEILLLWTKERSPFERRIMPPKPHIPLVEAVQGLTGLGLEALAEQFQSLGRNCEFGLVQRKMGVEPLGLLRFASIPPTKLLEGLDLGFDGIDEPGNVMIYTNDDNDGSEFLARDARYGVQFHTAKLRGHDDEDAVLQAVLRNLTFQRRKLLEDLRLGHKIFVFQNTGTSSLAQAWPLINMLRSHGPNTLLFVTEDRSHPPGTVEQIEPDLLHGHVQRLAPAHDVDSLILEPWIRLCANAYRLWRESGRGGE